MCEQCACVCAHVYLLVLFGRKPMTSLLHSLNRAFSHSVDHSSKQLVSLPVSHCHCQLNYVCCRHRSCKRLLFEQCATHSGMTTRIYLLLHAYKHICRDSTAQARTWLNACCKHTYSFLSVYKYMCICDCVQQLHATCETSWPFCV